MSQAIRGGDQRVASAHAATVALVSREAMARNLERGIAAGARGYDPSTLRADAWGHGRERVEGMLRASGLGPIAASADPGVVLDPVRLYGLPGAGTAATPVLRLQGTVLATKRLLAGEGVSYGYRYRAAADTRIALVTGGYAQGVVRSLGNAVDVLTESGLMPIVGRVAMDVCVIEIGEAPVARGQRAVFFGDPEAGHPSLAAWTRATGLQAAELVTAVGLHAARREEA